MTAIEHRNRQQIHHAEHYTENRNKTNKIVESRFGGITSNLGNGDGTAEIFWREITNN